MQPAGVLLGWIGVIDGGCMGFGVRPTPQRHPRLRSLYTHFTDTKLIVTQTSRL
jgi:hypothetical protein